ncbi:mechanosensitive ion channel protein MscS [Plantactinospora sp. KBS50]|nr:mechanosensitive ion channel family protein [Plantactinospora sp. KBS50]ASW56326.1 mechanosensitive ion channel protein MscS [Plantactinospora sp. KBS50]
MSPLFLRGPFVLAPVPSGSPSPDPSHDCLGDAFCKQVWDLTGSAWFADGSYWIIVKPLRIILILLGAMLIRFLLNRSISRLVRTTSRKAVPGILRPLRERPPAGAAEPGPVLPERRRQRAEAIGSVLRSGVTAVVFAIAALTVLSELSIDLGPLLTTAGIAGVAIGFGAQSLVKDLIAGLFMLIEDQYGVGDTVDLGEATGVVESVGLRVTTVRDGRGVLWYIRNGEIVRVGNKSQGWAMVVVDLPVGFGNTEEALTVLHDAAAQVAADPALAPSIVEPPEVLGVEQVTVDGPVIRTVAKTTASGQIAVGRRLRRQLAEALDEAGITARMAGGRGRPRPAVPGGSAGAAPESPPVAARGSAVGDEPGNDEYPGDTPGVTPSGSSDEFLSGPSADSPDEPLAEEDEDGSGRAS